MFREMRDIGTWQSSVGFMQGLRMGSLNHAR